MKRRDFVTSVLVAGIATPVIGDSTGGKDKGPETQEGHDGHGHHDDDERHRNAVVTFGHWNPSPTNPFDRFGADPNNRTRNGHELTPNRVRIHVGDTVNFIISGFHLVLVYGPGTQPADIDLTNLILSTPPPPFPPLINDPTNRVYRGLDPRTQASQDRVEAVGFNAPGKYLVLCGVLPHFFDPATGNFIMFGYVEVGDDN